MPVNIGQRLDYLGRERDLLIQIISDYQLEFKAYPISLTLSRRASG